MRTYEYIKSRRTIRQFKPEAVPHDLLQKFVNAARLAPSAANLQPLEYIVVTDEKVRKQIFPCLKWAGYISPAGDPKPGQEPVAYIVVVVNTSIREKGYERDVGAAMENMILTAWEDGVCSCWIVSVDRKKVGDILNITESYRLDSVLALGYPAEKSVMEDMKDSVEYWKDENDCLHVPKRKLEDLIHLDTF